MESGITYVVLFYLFAAMMAFSAWKSHSKPISPYPAWMLYSWAVFQFVWGTGGLCQVLNLTSLAGGVKLLGAVLAVVNGVILLYWLAVRRSPAQPKSK
jgi:hypothetical protein